jgi:hypothetical protein
LPEEQNSLTGAVILIAIIFVALIAAVVIQNENRNSIDNATSTDLAVVIDSTSIDSTSIDSAVIENVVVQHFDIQNVDIAPEPEIIFEPESSQLTANLNAEDRKVMSVVQEHYDFYNRDYIFRKPLVKKTNDYNYVVSVKECLSKGSFKDSDSFWRARLIYVRIDESGKLEIGMPYR